jgi:hypothetical protein
MFEDYVIIITTLFETGTINIRNGRHFSGANKWLTNKLEKLIELNNM